VATIVVIDIAHSLHLGNLLIMLGCEFSWGRSWMFKIALVGLAAGFAVAEAESLLRAPLVLLLHYLYLRIHLCVESPTCNCPAYGL
jgi:hypothetical protein